eukprot:5976417-Amphidinium_carterae.1
MGSCAFSFAPSALNELDRSLFCCWSENGHAIFYFGKSGMQQRSEASEFFMESSMSVRRVIPSSKSAHAHETQYQYVSGARSRAILTTCTPNVNIVAQTAARINSRPTFKTLGPFRGSAPRFAPSLCNVCETPWHEKLAIGEKLADQQQRQQQRNLMPVRYSGQREQLEEEVKLIHAIVLSESLRLPQSQQSTLGRPYVAGCKWSPQ